MAINLRWALIFFIFFDAVAFSQSASEAVGSPANGHLLRASELPDSAPGMVKIFQHRDRGYGVQELTDGILNASKKMIQRFPRGERIQVGDLSLPEGGEISRHKSHETGVDADLAYLRKDFREIDPSVRNGFPDRYVRKGQVSQVFDARRNWEWMKELMRSTPVNRIFVDAAIKRLFCRQARARGRLAQESIYLRHLRPLRLHADHFHIRIECASDDLNCQVPAPPARGSGCGQLESRFDWGRRFLDLDS